MSKIDKLPAEVIARFPEIRQKWIDIGLRTRTDRPLESAWDGICQAYVSVGRAKPRFHVWMESPYRALIACGVLKGALAQVSDQVRDQVRDQVSAQVSDQVSDQVSAQVSDQVRDQVSAQVSDQVRDQVSAQVRDQVSAQVRAQVRAQVSDQVRDQVSAQVRDQVRAQVSAQVRAQVSDQVSAFVDRWGWWYPGQFDACFLSFYETLKDYCDFDKLAGLVKVAENCSWCWTFPDIVVFAASPTVLARDDRGRLHSDTGPCVAFSDGVCFYSVHGVVVPEYVVMRPHEITVGDIQNETNQEIRRVKLDRFGQARFILESGAKEVHRDDFGILYRTELPGDEPLVMVKVVNSTPEPDGSFKDYFIRVPPTVERARQGVAWTFDIAEHNYELAAQT